MLKGEEDEDATLDPCILNSEASTPLPETLIFQATQKPEATNHADPDLLKNSIANLIEENRPKTSNRDHIRENVKLQGKMQKITEIKSVFRNYARDKNIKNMIQYKDEMDMV